MTRDEIIKLAREAGFCASSFHGRWAAYTDDLERFAPLIAAVEREACAALCQDHFMSDGHWCANAISARETT